MNTLVGSLNIFRCSPICSLLLQKEKCAITWRVGLLTFWLRLIWMKEVALISLNLFKPVWSQISHLRTIHNPWPLTPTPNKLGDMHTANTFVCNILPNNTIVNTCYTTLLETRAIRTGESFPSGHIQMCAPVYIQVAPELTSHQHTRPSQYWSAMKFVAFIGGNYNPFHTKRVASILAFTDTTPSRTTSRVPSVGRSPCSSR